MRYFRSRNFRVGLIILILTILIIHVRSQYVREHSDSPLSLAISQLGAQAFAEYNTKGQVLGNPSRTVRAMMILDKVLHSYQEKHNGHLPTNTTELVQELYFIPHGYGFKNLDEVDKVIKSPDWRFSDRWVLAHGGPTTKGHPESFVPYIILNHRPDGTHIGSPKLPGARDVVMYTDMYYHVNNHWLSDHNSTQKPVGFFLILWENGQVQKISYSQIRFVPTNIPGQFEIGFPGQAGVPLDALTYKQYYQKFNIKRSEKTSSNHS